MPTADHQRLRHHLDALAELMASATDADDVTTAYRLLRHLEVAVDIAAAGTAELPPAPVLARRFAVAHRRALATPDEQVGTLYRSLVPGHAPRFLPASRRADRPSGSGARSLQPA